jgi:hypothetical protein
LIFCEFARLDVRYLIHPLSRVQVLQSLHIRLSGVLSRTVSPITPLVSFLICTHVASIRTSIYLCVTRFPHISICITLTFSPDAHLLRTQFFGSHCYEFHLPASIYPLTIICSILAPCPSSHIEGGYHLLVHLHNSHISLVFTSWFITDHASLSLPNGQHEPPSPKIHQSSNGPRAQTII